MVHVVGSEFRDIGRLTGVGRACTARVSDTVSDRCCIHMVVLWCLYASADDYLVTTTEKKGTRGVRLSRQGSFSHMKAAASEKSNLGLFRTAEQSNTASKGWRGKIHAHREATQRERQSCRLLTSAKRGYKTDAAVVPGLRAWRLGSLDTSSRVTTGSCRDGHLIGVLIAVQPLIETQLENTIDLSASYLPERR